MEGLTSNFFALHRGALLTAGDGVLGGTIREIVLEVRNTYSLGARGVGGGGFAQGGVRPGAGAGRSRRVCGPRLPGWRGLRQRPSPRRPAPQVCRELGVPVELQPPNLADAAAWDAAFISSTSRLLLPADELRWHAAAAGGGGEAGAGAAGAGEERVRRFGGQCELAARLEAAVAARILADSEPVPLPRQL